MGSFHSSVGPVASAATLVLKEIWEEPAAMSTPLFLFVMEFVLFFHSEIGVFDF